MLKKDVDPHLDPSLLDPINSVQEVDVDSAIKSTLLQAQKNGFPTHMFSRLRDIVYFSHEAFRVAFSSGPPEKMTPLKIDLTSDATPVKVRLRNYSVEQREFLQSTVENLTDAGVVYPNHSTCWASAPLLVAKPGPAKFRFKVDLSSVNRYTCLHNFPMPHLGQELTKISR